MRLKFIIIVLMAFSLTFSAKDKIPSKTEIVNSMTGVCNWQLANL
ncbi:MAG: hypothetical protein ACOYMD_15845 [Paludibacter sp.]